MKGVGRREESKLASRDADSNLNLAQDVFLGIQIGLNLTLGANALKKCPGS